MCVEYDKLKNKCSCSELRDEDLVEKLKCELCRVMIARKEEECLGVEDTIEKIFEEHELEAIA